MFKKVVIFFSLFLFVAGCGMFYSVQARREAARVAWRKNQALLAAQLAEKQKAEKLARQNQAQNEDMNEILRQAPIEFEHLKKNSKLEQIAQTMQQKSKVALSAQIAQEQKADRWRELLTATGYEISARRRPSNAGVSAPPQVVPFDERNVTVIPYNKLTTTCSVLKNPSFGATLKLNPSGNVVAVAPLSKDMKIPIEDIKSCKFKILAPKLKLTMYKTMILPTRKAGNQANL